MLIEVVNQSVTSIEEYQRKLKEWMVKHPNQMLDDAYAVELSSIAHEEDEEFIHSGVDYELRRRNLEEAFKEAKKVLEN